MPGSTDWSAPTASHALDATVQLPGSKSLTNRFLVLAALANGTSRLRRPLRSRDTLLMAEALRSLGAGVEDYAGDDPQSPDWLITPATLDTAASIDCGLAGTVMRFLPPVAALADAPVRFDGDAGARVRPMAPLLGALRDLGVRVEDEGRGRLPFTIAGTGAVRGGQVVLDASSSSQFISALLLAGPRFDEGITVVHRGEPVPSAPHLQMTVEVLRDAGAVVDDGEDTWRVEPGEIHPLEVQVEPDLSGAAPFVAAPLVAGGCVRVPGWPQHTSQAGDALRDILDAMGADVLLDRAGLTVRGGEPIAGLDVDLHDVGELTPVVAALAALATSPSRLRGIAHLRGHETDRLHALATELGALGAQVEESPDALHIVPRPLHGGTFHTYDDHRMAMAAAVLGLAVPGLVVENIATTGKTLPDFPGMWTGLLSGETPSTDRCAADEASDPFEGRRPLAADPEGRW
ncbi:MAG TPA: 3-phosphoshikimate 1-carboxyvinyltransferase [Segeticoccus sp.]|nr:3-phosphoshikimate 1-carboxyvinyltransferase [Segeticoccus sp.]HET8602212.1 3-phosphoshikimate 1-carboxyvinyltransferase [Segeticoccus sp.]